MHQAQINFCLSVKQKHPELFKGVDVLDIGSLDINGNNRYLFEDYTYTGVDLGPGKNVDIVSKGHEYNPSKKFDVVISTECFEHDKYWRQTIQNGIKLLEPNGLFLFTCASEGRPEHGTDEFESWASPYSNTYYKNLIEKDVWPYLKGRFNPYIIKYNNIDCDLYFYGIKK
jgi:SAM-dependent methyltransferase